MSAQAPDGRPRGAGDGAPVAEPGAVASALVDALRNAAARQVTSDPAAFSDLPRCASNLAVRP